MSVFDNILNRFGYVDKAGHLSIGEVDQRLEEIKATLEMWIEEQP